MFALHLRFSFLLVFAFLGLALTGCQTDDDDPAPTTISSQYLTVGSWQLDAIQQNSQTTSSGTGIKDRYTLTFRPDGTYTQKLLADNTTYNGTWMLMGNNTVLHFTDHKGADHQYVLASLTATELRYNWTNKENKLEEFVFSAQP